jgi:hypothetical protein
LQPEQLVHLPAEAGIELAHTFFQATQPLEDRISLSEGGTNGGEQEA